MKAGGLSIASVYVIWIHHDRRGRKMPDMVQIGFLQ